MDTDEKRPTHRLVQRFLTSLDSRYPVEKYEKRHPIYHKFIEFGDLDPMIPPSSSILCLSLFVFVIRLDEHFDTHNKNSCTAILLERTTRSYNAEKIEDLTSSTCPGMRVEMKLGALVSGCDQELLD